MSKREQWSEQEAAALVVDYLTSVGMDVYQEVEMCGPIADIVAVRGPEIWIVETKTTWSLDLFEQLRYHWQRGNAHRLFAAVPESRNDHSRNALAEMMGFGAITIRRPFCSGEVNLTRIEKFPPRLTSHPLPKTMERLHNLSEDHRRMARAGAPASERSWTPFRLTCDHLAKVVEAHPGISLKEALAQVKHHYASDRGAYQSLSGWIMQGKVRGVKIKYPCPAHKILLIPDHPASEVRA